MQPALMTRHGCSCIDSHALRHKLGWSMWELDQAMLTLGATTLDSALIANLADIVRLRGEISEPVDVLLAFWGSIITDGTESLYDRLFQNTRVTRPLDPAFELNATRTELATMSEALSDHATTVQAALRLNADEYAGLLQTTGLDNVSSTLNLANLSLLYRHAALARSLNLKVGELIALLVLTGDDPFTSPETTVAFVRRAKPVVESRFKVSQLDYLYRHRFEPGQYPAPAEEQVLILLRETWKKGCSTSSIVRRLRRTHRPTICWTGLRCCSRLTLQSLRWRIIERLSPMSVVDQELFIDDHFADFLDVVDAKNELLGPTSLSDTEKALANRNYVWPKLLEFIRAIESASLVKQSLSTALPLDAEVLQPLIEEILPALSDPTKVAIDDFIALANAVDPEDLIPDYIRLHKLAILITGFSITADELRYLGEHGSDFGGFDLSGMPLNRDNPTTVDNDAPTLFDQWERLKSLFGIRDQLPEGDMTVLDVLGAPTGADARIALAELTGWPQDDIDLLSGPQALNLPDAAFKDGSAIGRLSAIFRVGRTHRRCHRTARRMGTATHRCQCVAGDRARDAGTLRRPAMDGRGHAIERRSAQAQSRGFDRSCAE